MTENPINPAALYDYAASKNDMDSLRPEERTFLEACAWEWERLIDHGAEEWGKQFEALGIKPGVPQAPSAKPTPAAPEKPAPSSPAAERADEGLEEEAERLREAYTNDEGSWLEWPDCRQEPWLRVARAARALRRGGVTEEPWGIVDDLALSGKVTDTMTAGQPARSRLRNELSAAVRERDQLAAKLAEAEGKLADTAARRATLSAMDTEIGELKARLAEAERSRDVSKALFEGAMHAQSMAEEDARTARAEAERLRGELRLAEAVSAVHEANAAPTVAVTDVEKAARKVWDRLACGGLPSAADIAADIRDCTRSVSVEEVAKAIRDVTGRWQIDPRINTSLYIAQAEAVLRALGVREAEKNATPFVVDRESVAQAIDAAWVAQPFNTYHAADAAIAEIERQRAEHAAKGGAS